MMTFLSRAFCMVWGFSSGMIISTGIVAFITAIGIIPRLVMKMQISKHVYAIGTTIIFAATFGAIWSMEGVSMPMPKFFIGIIAFGFGIFVGCLAIAVAEILNVMPVMDRRLHIKKGVGFFIIAFAIGKLLGALYYWQYPNFLVVG
ncbi:MAG: stage V sporulation protein AB [Cellulosilyticaceae bacterium]